MKKNFIWFTTFIVILGITAFSMCYKNSHPNNSKQISEETIPIASLWYEEINELPDIDVKRKGFTCTGLTYDRKRNTFWIGNYGKLTPSDKLKTPSIIQVSADFKTILSKITFTDSDIDIQGVSYDETTDTLWYSDGKQVINCDIEGNFIKSINLGPYSKYKPNGVSYDYQTETLWILCYYNYLLHYDLNGNLINSYQSDYIGQDHLCFNGNGQLCFSAGIDYNGSDNYVVIYSMDDMRIEKAYQVLESYAIEGISILDSTLFVVNDGLYHEAKINKNVVIKYTIP